MSDHIEKTAPPFQETPINPFFALDLGERWGRELGSIDSRLIRIENDILVVNAKIEKLNANIDAVEDRLNAKIDAVDNRVDKCLVAINRLDERTRNLTIMVGGGLAAVAAGLVLQYFK